MANFDCVDLNFLGEELPSKFFGSPQVQHRTWFDHLSLGFLSIILPSQVSATDVLKAMGAMPSGFRSTTLGKMVKEGELEEYFKRVGLSPYLPRGIFFSIFQILSFVAWLTYCLFLFLEILQTSSWVMPKLSQSNVVFQDITLDPVNKQVNN